MTDHAQADQPPFRLEDLVMPALLRHARTTYGKAMREALAEAGCDDIPGNGMYVLGALALGEVSVGQFIRDLRVSKQAAGQLIDALVLRGYVERATDPEDRRRITLSLTERGRSAAAVQAAARERIDTALTERVGQDNVRAARKALAALIAMNREAADDGVD
ncbi:MAG TPA: MarR family transcriptional regulator [Caulobacterales bacterium]|nr:MarR family transcriptional regulator [Caulobacterales bacterium]